MPFVPPTSLSSFDHYIYFLRLQGIKLLPNLREESMYQPRRVRLARYIALCSYTGTEQRCFDIQAFAVQVLSAVSR